MLVRPGDVLVGDRDGILVVSGEHAADIATDARKMVAVKEKQRARLIRGDDPQEVYADGDRYGHVRSYAPPTA